MATVCSVSRPGAYRHSNAPAACESYVVGGGGSDCCESNITVFVERRGKWASMYVDSRLGFVQFARELERQCVLGLRPGELVAPAIAAAADAAAQSGGGAGRRALVQDDAAAPNQLVVAYAGAHIRKWDASSCQSVAAATSVQPGERQPDFLGVRFGPFHVVVVPADVLVVAVALRLPAPGAGLMPPEGYELLHVPFERVPRTRERFDRAVLTAVRPAALAQRRRVEQTLRAQTNSCLRLSSAQLLPDCADTTRCDTVRCAPGYENGDLDGLGRGPTRFLLRGPAGGVAAPPFGPEDGAEDADELDPSLVDPSECPPAGPPEGDCSAAAEGEDGGPFGVAALAGWARRAVARTRRPVVRMSGADELAWQAYLRGAVSPHTLTVLVVEVAYPLPLAEYWASVRQFLAVLLVAALFATVWMLADFSLAQLGDALFARIRTVRLYAIYGFTRTTVDPDLTLNPFD